MKKLILLTLVSAFSLSMVAQDDDMYFVPTKENVAKEAKKYGMPQKTYYSGSNRSVDDYNRRAQFSNPADTTGNDIIDFSAVRGVYPDSAYSQSAENEDYALTRRMSRFDDYTPSEAYWAGYSAGRWSSPWRTSWYSWYDYDPWYWDSWYWNDPFYYSSWYSWRYPWSFSVWYSPRYYSYYRPWYGGGYRVGVGRSYSRAGVTHHKSTSSRRGTDLGGYRSSNSSRTYTPTRTTTNNSGNLGGYRSSGSSSSGGSFSSGGGSRGGGGFSGGGGGGGRSTGGGHSYGGRR
jgi:hypothetical protein